MDHPHRPLSIIYRPGVTMVSLKNLFSQIEVELMFDPSRKLLDRQVSGGEFVD